MGHDLCLFLTDICMGDPDGNLVLALEDRFLFGKGGLLFKDVRLGLTFYILHFLGNQCQKAGS